MAFYKIIFMCTINMMHAATYILERIWPWSQAQEAFPFTCPWNSKINIATDIEVEDVASQRWVCHKHDGIIVHLPIVPHCQSRSRGVVLGQDTQLHPSVIL